MISCGKLQSDESVSFPLMTVSKALTPEAEEIRSFIQYNDLIYTAAGSGGVLVYRIIGDTIEPVLPLSLTNLYSENLEILYVRTIELLETAVSTNLIFSYDTISGGGIGVLEINPNYTKPLGSFKTYPNLRIRQTISSYDPSGKFQILAADEGIGILSYSLSFESNNFFEKPKIASLIDYISYSEIQLPFRIFSALDAPGMKDITNISQITNLNALAQLAANNREEFLKIITNIPFLSKDTLDTVNKLVESQDKNLLSNALSTMQGLGGAKIVDQILRDPEIVNKILKSGILTNLDATSSAQDVLDNLPKDLISSIFKKIPTLKPIVHAMKNQHEAIDLDLQNILSLDGLQQSIEQEPVKYIPNDFSNLSPLDKLALSSNKNIAEFLNNPSIAHTNSNNSNKETETLYAEAYLSNLNTIAQKTININTIHDNRYNPFTNRQAIGNAGLEIAKTIQATGRRYFSDDNSEIKNKLNTFTQEELKILFQAIFQQANLIIKLIPLFGSTGVDIQEIYRLWKEQDFFEIVNRLDSSILAELLRLLPRYKIDTKFILENTNTVLPGIRNVIADSTTLYAAAGMNGLYIIDRISGEIISSHKKPFSEVSMVKPYEVFGKKYLIVTDILDGLLLYRRKNNNSIGEQISRVALVGETYNVLPYEDILWVADGSDGVLGVRVNRDESLVIEAETYLKDGIAYFIGSVRRREVLASYGADGLVRLRITNITPEQIAKLDQGNSRLNSLIDNDREKLDFVDKTLEWGRYSPIAQFINKLLYY